MNDSAGMNRYMAYVRRLEEIEKNMDAGLIGETTAEDVRGALDGEAAEKLRKLVPLSERRQTGAFFTDSRMAKRALQGLGKTLDRRSVILDPACGAGDLLLSCMESSLETHEGRFKPEDWSERIHGIDIHQEFVAATKIRLRLWAKNECLCHNLNFNHLNEFGIIRQGDALNEVEEIAEATHIVVNPPFGRVISDRTCFSGRGLISSAAVFLSHIIDCAEPGTKILSILPDVLRSGSHYANWRAHVSSKADIGPTTLLGQFDATTDVDVFAQEFVVKKATQKRSNTVWAGPVGSSVSTVGDMFDVTIGSVVDYRDPLDGVCRPYVVGKQLPKWSIVNKVTHLRLSRCLAVNSPFVVVRRTSRLGDQYRAVATIIDIDRPAVVDNHLIVLVPRDGRLSHCRRLVKTLKDRRTTSWLNERIRCRHLTKASLSELPTEW